MTILRRRLIFWLIKEYFKKWRKTIVFFFLFGLIFFFTLNTFFAPLLSKIPIGQHDTIGIVGAFRVDNLPSLIMNDISRGLTTVDEGGNIKPDIAHSWEIKDGGKTYIFHLRPNVYFSDRTNLVSSLVTYNFSDVAVDRPTEYTIVFKLKDVYGPFLVTVSRPIVKKGFVGVGEYLIKDVKLNGTFVQSLTLYSTKNIYKTKKYLFYPSAEALKTAFILGEVSKAVNLPDITYRNTSFQTFTNAKIVKSLDYTKLVTLFYNTKDSFLSDRDTRIGLSYGLPDIFSDGNRAVTMYPPTSWAYESRFLFSEDLTNAQLLTKQLRGATKSATMKLELKTLRKYEKTAKEIAREWKKIKIETVIVPVDSVPIRFQIFLGDFYLPPDPDQYMLWHSGQENNITKYENKRIDKLLEDGRKSTDNALRKKIYSDFQKYLLADAPAAFLYFPNIYTAIRQ